jgi:hypothetical protein
MRLKGLGVEGDEANPLNSSSSAPSSVALWVVIAADTCFILLLAAETIARAATQGAAYLRDPWVRVDLAVLVFSIARALFPAWVPHAGALLTPHPHPNPNLLSPTPTPTHTLTPTLTLGAHAGVLLCVARLPRHPASERAQKANHLHPPLSTQHDGHTRAARTPTPTPIQALTLPP